MTEEERLYSLLQPFVVTAHRMLAGMEPAPGNFVADLRGAFADEPKLLEYAKDEIARLSALGQRRLSEHDYESKIRHAAIKALIEESEGTNP